MACTLDSAWLRLHRKQCPKDCLPRKMLTMGLDILRAPERLSPLHSGGLWWAVVTFFLDQPTLVPVAIEAGLLDLAVSHMRRIGTPTELLVCSLDFVPVLAGCSCVALVCGTEHPP